MFSQSVRATAILILVFRAEDKISRLCRLFELADAPFDGCAAKSVGLFRTEWFGHQCADEAKTFAGPQTSWGETDALLRPGIYGELQGRALAQAILRLSAILRN